MATMYKSTVIANGDTVSPAIECGNNTLSVLQFPAALTSTTMTFQGSLDGTTFGVIEDEAGAALSIAVAATVCVSLTTGNFRGYKAIKLVAGSAEGAARTIQYSLVNNV